MVFSSYDLLKARKYEYCSHERTPVDEAVSRGKLDVMDVINEAAAQAELDGASVS